jgi:hypothetical protein
MESDYHVSGGLGPVYRIARAYSIEYININDPNPIIRDKLVYVLPPYQTLKGKKGSLTGPVPRISRSPLLPFPTSSMESLRGHNLCQDLFTASLGIWRVLADLIGLALTSKLLVGGCSLSRVGRFLNFRPSVVVVVVVDVVPITLFLSPFSPFYGLRSRVSPSYLRSMC